MSDLDFGSLNEKLARSTPAENFERSLDPEFREAFPDVVKSMRTAPGAATERNLLRSAGPISDAYILGNELMMLITGPGGSGKTTASVKKMLVEAQRIWPGPDGVRRYVCTAWRNKYVNLWSATIPSYWKVLPKDLPGSHWVGAPPRNAEHVVQFEDAWGKAILLVRFRAFGETMDPLDIRGNETTDNYLNEWSTMPEDLTIALGDRVGREPPREIIRRVGRFFGDDNAPDVESYIYRDFYEKPPKGYHLYRQPGGLEPNAENIQAVGREYYEASVQRNIHRPWWIKIMVHAKPGFARAVDPVYPKFDDDRNVSPTSIAPLKHIPVLVGIDGALTPAASYCQELPSGQFLILGEVQIERGGMRELSIAMLALEARRFADCEFVDVCDPAMCAGEEEDDRGNVVPAAESEVSEGSERQRLAQYLGREVEAAPTNEVTERIAAVAGKFDLTMEGGRPGLMISGPDCPGHRRGFNQTFHFRRVQGTNDRGSIAKTFDGHVCEANQYAALKCGSTEARRRVSDRRREIEDRRAQARAAKRYDPFAARRAG